MRTRIGSNRANAMMRIDFFWGQYIVFLDAIVVRYYDKGMARISRVVVPGVAHHITQRGNRRQKVFFHDSDYRAYIELMSEWCGKCGACYISKIYSIDNCYKLSMIPTSCGWRVRR
jgi:hypothetical protein